MTKIKYVGRVVPWVGKPLWEILGNLRDFGVGRLVTRGTYYRYPEPSFYKIIKVQTVPPHRIRYIGRKVIAVVEKIFRGERYPQLIEIFEATYKSDYQLIPKDEEELWYKRLAECKPRQKIVDSKMDFPPLLKLILTEERKARGETVGDLKMDVQINDRISNVARVAGENETPTHRLSMKFSNPSAPSLYENIEKCRPLFVDRDPWEDFRKHNKKTFWV